MAAEHTPPPRRRLAHRIPVRMRQYWKLLAMLAVVSVGLVVILGEVRVRPYITGDTTVMTADITDNIAGSVDLFDHTVAHSLTVDISSAEYSDMITSYEKDGEKKWVTADLTIDGTVVSDVAVRPKGNSTLMGLRGGHGFPAGAPAGEGPTAPMADDGTAPPQDGAGTGMVAMASADDPTTLPLLIKFDENAAGRGYQGMTELSVRPGTPVLNEAMALSLTSATGQPTQRYGYATYTINGKTTTRLLLEHPDDAYAESLFESDGYLYKADANSRFEYVGEDQSAYSEQFTQINSADSGNLQPIINVLRWLDGADQREFDQHLAEWVDVESLSRYLATSNLLVNGDDMAGPGQNYYLWYDLESSKISVISWDLNLAMQSNAATGPDDDVQVGPPPGMDGAGARPDTPAGGQDGGPRFGNQLKTRFLESDVWSARYHEAYWPLYEQMFADGRAQDLLDEIAASVPVTDGLSAEDLASSVATMEQWIGDRVSALDAVRDE